MENTLTIIKNQYGINLLSDPEKVLSYFADLKPGDTKTLRRLKFFFQSGAAGIISSNIGSPEIAFQKAVAKYSEYTDSSDEVSETFIAGFFSALEITIELNTSMSQKDLYGQGLDYYNKQNYAKAFEMFSDGVENKYPSAFSALGRMYFEGIYVEMDPEKAFQLFFEGAQLGSPACMYSLYILYLDGRGVAKDTEKAYNWLRKAAQNESDSALFVMAALSYEKQSPEAFSYAKKACELKNENAPVVLGLCYLQGIGTAINFGMAKKCFQEVIESSSGSNLSTAYYYLALMYIDGLGCERNINIANQYMQTAYNLGHPLAKDYIDGVK